MILWTVGSSEGRNWGQFTHCCNLVLSLGAGRVGTPVFVDRMNKKNPRRGLANGVTLREFMTQVIQSWVVKLGRDVDCRSGAEE